MIRVGVITVSDSAVAGTRVDSSGPAIAEWCGKKLWEVPLTAVVPDEPERISGLIAEWIDTNSADVVITTGGTGVSLRDRTPEATKAVADREIPGFGELMRAEGLKKTPLAPLSRGGAHTRGAGLILNLPGSPKGALESLEAVAALIPHVIDLLQGRTEHGPETCDQKKKKLQP